MNNVYFGIVIGLLLYFSGERFLKFVTKALKERREAETKRAEKNLVMIVEKIIEKKEE